ncbi:MULTISPECIES: Rid family detoxifying hydrolase [unclassified Siphonobacter]|uniref:Rid family detoxifying hydrolase n=1 Tax=unclassified Siphonobacter TaxID=2635712 RepID=UPI00278449CB|nr:MULTISPECIES: Rid family detoxifying hydrolase [unclassified Siphonobacter]MDQ1088100.1 2-iminobutanoate/2-iminopropanoate deaminase [Siphonobacter sp. SORGH_AS_1065]MDR6194249.1 2-iminobutanoate/2-iminopropanoate deaminase [Siphonobacter sp. SORGH_AS_0500]
MIRRLLLITSILGYSSFAWAQKKIHHSEMAPAPIGPYSQAVEANGLVFVAGQIGIHPNTKKLVTGGVEAEVPQIMENILAILKAAHLDYTNIVNTTIYVKDLSDFQRINTLYGKYFQSNYPARTTVGVSDLPAGANVEITVIAARMK